MGLEGGKAMALRYFVCPGRRGVRSCAVFVLDQTSQAAILADPRVRCPGVGKERMKSRITCRKRMLTLGVTCTRCHSPQPRRGPQIVHENIETGTPFLVKWMFNRNARRSFICRQTPKHKFRNTHTVTSLASHVASRTCR